MQTVIVVTNKQKKTILVQWMAIMAELLDIDSGSPRNIEGTMRLRTVPRKRVIIRKTGCRGATEVVAASPDAIMQTTRSARLTRGVHTDFIITNPNRMRTVVVEGKYRKVAAWHRPRISHCACVSPKCAITADAEVEM
jgi:hypothetical protein